MLSIIKHALQKVVARDSQTATTPIAMSPTASPATRKTVKGRAARSSGYDAEQAAANWLTAQGLHIVERNVRYAFGEIDIVAWHGTTLVLFEVRMRKSNRFGGAAASITPTKQARLTAAGGAYAATLKPIPPMRIDVLAYDSEHQSAPLWIQNALG